MSAEVDTPTVEDDDVTSPEPEGDEKETESAGDGDEKE